MLELSRHRLIEWVAQDVHQPMHSLLCIIDSLGDEVAREIRTQLRHEVERLRSIVGDLIAISSIDAVSADGRVPAPDEAPLSLAG